MNRFIFDLNDTLIARNCKIEPDYYDFLSIFTKHNHCYLVTSEDYDYCETVLPKELLDSFDFIFACNGNAVYKQGKLYSCDDWLPDDLLLAWIDKADYICSVKYATGTLRVNFLDNTEVGQRTFCHSLERRFPLLSCSMVKSSFVDITKNYQTKQQILKHFAATDTLLIFADNTHPLGNDYTLVSDVIDNNLGSVYSIESIDETYQILQALQARGDAQ